MKKIKHVPQEGTFHNHVLRGVGRRSLAMRINQENIRKRSTDETLSTGLSLANSLAAALRIPEDANKDTLIHSKQFFLQIWGHSQKAVQQDLWSVLPPQSLQVEEMHKLPLIGRFPRDLGSTVLLLLPLWWRVSGNKNLICSVLNFFSWGNFTRNELSLLSRRGKASPSVPHPQVLK